MSHFAKVEDGIVVDVIVADQEFVDNLDGVWIQTSYNTLNSLHLGTDTQPDGGTALRHNFAGVGFNYNAEIDAFYPQSPFPSWTLNDTTCDWEAPTPEPEVSGENSLGFIWDEANLKWVESFLPDPE